MNQFFVQAVVRILCVASRRFMLVCMIYFQFVYPCKESGLSLVVDTENNASAEEGGILVGPGGIVVIFLVPEALAGDTHTLAQDLTDDDLADNFVTWDAQLLYLLFDFSDNLFSHLLVFGVIELNVLKSTLDDLLNDVVHLGRVKSLVLSWLHPVGGQVSHALLSEVHLLILKQLQTL